MVHNIQVAWDVHPNSMLLQVDIANVFNIISLRIIFQKMCVSGGQLFQLIPFVCFLMPQNFFYLVTIPFRAIFILFNFPLALANGSFGWSSFHPSSF
jgi:hypothetical protein